MTEDEKMLRGLIDNAYIRDEYPTPFTPEGLDVGTMQRGFFIHPRAWMSDPIFTSGNHMACWIGMKLRFTAWSSVPAASLPGDEEEIRRIACVTPKRWASIRHIVLHDFYLCSDGRYYHFGLSCDALVANRARDRGRKNARQRWHGEAEERI